jgi:hypothetical protein
MAYWQQRADYQMDIQLDVKTHRYGGKSRITYTNNSPDILDKVFFHLYNNAFQPGSQMDIRSRTIADPDSRVGTRISQLGEAEQGWIHVKSLKLNGRDCSLEEVETILEVTLPESIKPGAKVVFEMEWEAQSPIQIRRSGRSNKEGVAYSMSQWYPKLCEYDMEGWHSNPYVGREFHGVWGNFLVNITLDSRYVVGAGGVLLNSEEIGYGYQKAGTKMKVPAGSTLTWKWKAENVHDFMWAADPDYLHDIYNVKPGLDLHFLYQNDSTILENWKALQPKVAEAIRYLSEHFGDYPYPVYSVIQGGDGGMEYPMGTLITGKRSFGSLLGVTVHELAHMWYHGMLATNEALYEWMDEGFCSYASSECMNAIAGNQDPRPHTDAYDSYLEIAGTEEEEALSTHADHYNTNRAYGIAAYSKGEVLLDQLGYVIGRKNLKKGLLNYFEEWKFRHPDSRDFKRVMEKTSGLELDWYFEYFEYSTKTIDYAVRSLSGNGSGSQIVLERAGLMPMPVEVRVELRSGAVYDYYIPLELMRGAKPVDERENTVFQQQDWPWTHPYYALEVAHTIEDILSVTIDPEGGTADVNPDNNSVEPGDVEGIYFFPE